MPRDLLGTTRRRRVRPRHLPFPGSAKWDGIPAPQSTFTAFQARFTAVYSAEAAP